jgi:hypothetical protein
MVLKKVPRMQEKYSTETSAGFLDYMPLYLGGMNPSTCLVYGAVLKVSLCLE